MGAFTSTERPEWAVGQCGHLTSRGETLHCNKDGTWHGMMIGGSKITAMMVSCDDHAADMRLSADYAHELVHPCCIPGSVFRWPENECVTEWSAAAEFAALQEATA